MAIEAAPKKKSAFGGLKGLFIQEVPEAQNEPTTVTRAAPVYTPAPVVTQRPVVADEKTEQYKTTLLDALEANRLKEYDYLKFKSSLQELASDIPDERMRYKAVFATAKAMGITKDKLIDTANHYVLVLDQELKNFNEALGEEVDSRIVAAETSVKGLDADLAAKQEQIAHLSEQIAELSQKRNELVTKITQEKATIESRKNGFVAAQSAMVQSINTDITKLSGYLG